MFKFKVMPDEGEPYEVTATTRDIAKWEKTTTGATFARLQDERRIGDLYRIAFYAALRQGLYTGSLADFESTVDFDVVDDEEADPTQPAA